MALPLSRSRANQPPDPVRQQLREVRIGLLRLHKSLIDSERQQFESRTGPLSNTQFLQALLEDPFFAWLRPFSGLIVAMDEALFGEEPLTEEHVRGFAGQVRGLLAPERGSEEARRYERIRQRDPGVLVAHVELVRRVSAVVPEEEGGDAAGA